MECLAGNSDLYNKILHATAGIKQGPQRMLFLLLLKEMAKAMSIDMPVNQW